MKELLIAFAVALSLVSTDAFADVGHDHDKHQNEALGKPGDPNKVSRTIRVDMNDAMRFIPDRISIKRGETIKFLVTNSGNLKHEMVLIMTAYASVKIAAETLPTTTILI